MPDSLIREFDLVRKFFRSNLDERCVPLLLNSFGSGDGHGVYQLVEDTILAYPDDVVVDALKVSLRNPAGSVQYWSAQIAANYPREELAGLLVQLLKTGDVNERIAAVTALETQGSVHALTELKNALNIEPNEEVRSLIRDALNP